MIRGLRGATTVENNDAEIIAQETEVLLRQMIEKMILLLNKWRTSGSL